ncbi:MAG: vWA domain-containing protein [Methanoregula sp.]|jgi:Flp pilus assembly protein TadG|uniref:pilus assembly protein TadG-related protein n=1 Tax=Methanoregula sp. TaxID=2052170 RepID=UPI003D1305B1
MAKIVRNVKTKFSRMERGQVLVLVAAAAIGIIAIIGLSIDVGLMFIGNARLRRAVDSAALSAALQYRENASTSQANLLNILTNSANEFMVLNGFTNPVTHVYDCYNSPPDLTTTLCTTPNPRKLVEVTATVDIPLAFLTVIGINSVPVSATAISEAASVDVVLVIDRSESMTYGPDYLHTYAPGDPMRDPFYCNGQPPTDGSGDIGSCQPFDQVINAAARFTNILVPSYDLASVVTFDKEPTVVLPLLSGNDPSVVASKLRNLTVYQGVDAYKNASSSTDDYRCYGPSGGQCSGSRYLACTADPILGSGSNYQGLIGQGQDPCLPAYDPPPDSSHYTTTNIGGGLELAGNQLATDHRQDVLWVVILLTDGVPNAGHNDDDTIYFCPQDTWSLLPRCNHGNPADRLTAPVSGPYALEYDASDYAYDMADFVGLPYPKGQNALLYTIGLGPEVDNPNYKTNIPANFVDINNTDPDIPGGIGHGTGESLGRIFLNYAAAAGRGSAFYAAEPSDLDKIFTLIGSNIATRISQ